jgi:hypothetical protein
MPAFPLALLYNLQAGQPNEMTPVPLARFGYRATLDPFNRKVVAWVILPGKRWTTNRTWTSRCRFNRVAIGARRSRASCINSISAPMIETVQLPYICGSIKKTASWPVVSLPEKPGADDV